MVNRVELRDEQGAALVPSRRVGLLPMTSLRSAKSVKYLGTALAVVAFLFVFKSLFQDLDSILAIRIDFSLGFAILAGVLANMASIVLGSIVWQRILGELGAPLSRDQSFVIFGQSQIGKYLPGNVFHYVGRAGLAVRAGINVTLVVTSMSWEVLSIVLTATLLSIPVLFLHGPAITESLPERLPMAVALIGGLILVSTVAYLFARKGRKIRSLILAPASYRTLVFILFIQALMFFALGWSLWLLFAAMGPAEASYALWYCICAFALAWVVGFLTPGSPGGIGIREAAFLFLFGGVNASGVVAAIVLIGRVQSVLADVLTFFWASYRGRTRREEDRPRARADGSGS